MDKLRLEVERWLNHPNVNWELKQQIKELNESEIQELFSLEKPLFGTAGVRNKMAPGYHGMNVFSYAYLTQGYVKYIESINEPKRQLRFLVARDTRKNGGLFLETVCDVITSMGHLAYVFDDNQPVSTPLVSHVIFKYGFSGGINITASHNPKDDNGFKVYDHTGAQLLDTQTNQLLSDLPCVTSMLDLELQPNPKFVHTLDNEKVYKNYFRELKKVLVINNNNFKDIKVVFSGLNGTSVCLMQRFLKYLGYSNIISVEEQNWFDENFENAPNLNPEYKDTWILAQKYAKKNNAKLIIMADPDADRFAIAELNNNQWHYFSGNETGAITAYYKLNHKVFKSPYIVSTFVSTYLVNKIAKRYGAFVHRTNVGFKYIGQAINELSQTNELVVGFEEAIGLITSDKLNREKDAYQAAALLLEIARHCKEQNITLLDFYKRILSEFGEYFNLTISHPFKATATDWKEEIKALFNQLINANLTEVAGFKVVKVHLDKQTNILEFGFENCWVKFRFSGTEPKLKFYFDLTNGTREALEKQAKKIYKFFVNLLKLNKA
ncbi:phospho-sugar mutase [Mycoplasmoides genitalium]